MQIIKWEPLKEIDRFFEDRFFHFPRLGWDLAVDVYEEDGAVVAKMSLPGVKPAALKEALLAASAVSLSFLAESFLMEALEGMGALLQEELGLFFLFRQA